MPDLHRLVGRDQETAAVAHLLRDLPARGAAVAWSGERGHGRTAVLGAASLLAARRGLRTLSIRGLAASGEAGLMGAVHAQLGGVEHVAPVTGGDTGWLHRLLLRLSDRTETGPVVVCLDDVDLLAPGDFSSVAFAARRLTSVPVLLLLTTRPTLSMSLERGGVPVRAVRALTQQESTQVLADRHPDLHPQVSARIVAEAAGSPVALVELPIALTSQQRQGDVDLPAALPLTDRLRELFSSPWTTLSRLAQEVLILAAIGGPNGVLSLVGPDRSMYASAVDELERAGLLRTRTDGARLEFSHPLIRSAVVDRADDADLVHARDLLAAAFPTDPGEQAWHLAGALGEEDGYLASRLERIALRALDRGDPETAVTAMVRAAHLSPDRVARSRRLLHAARLRATVTGELDAAAASLAEASRADAGAASGTRAAAVSGQLLMAGGAPLGEVYRLVVQALRSHATDPSPDPLAAEACVRLLFYVCLMTASAERWRVFDQLAETHGDPGSVVGLLRAVLPDVTRTTSATLAELDAAIDRLTDAMDPAEVIAVSIAAYHLDRLGRCRAALAPLVDGARRGRLVGVGGEAMLRLALDDCHTGQLDSAARLAAEGLALTREHHRDEHIWTFQLCLGLVAAFRGDQARVDAISTQLLSWAVPRGATLVRHHCAHLQGLAALGRADFDAAYEHGVSINPPGTLAGHTNVTFAASLDLVEAALGSRREAEAHAHAHAMAESGMRHLSPRLSLRVATAEAMTASDRDAAELFDRALAIPQVTRWPFDRARTHLAYGTRLRRLHLTATAAPQLSTAFETFRRMGARGWAQRAVEEIRAAGLPLPPGERMTRAVLTGRDLDVARLAAAGLSNREIGARLFLSPRTVGSRLYRIYPKLGVSSRAGLRDALEEQSEHER